MTASLVSAGTARVSAVVAAAFGEAAGPRVVLEPALTLVRLPDREFGRGPRDRLALDARQLRPNQRPVETHFLGRNLRRRVAIVAVLGCVLRLLRLFVTQCRFCLFGFRVSH